MEIILKSSTYFGSQPRKKHQLDRAVKMMLICIQTISEDHILKYTPQFMQIRRVQYSELRRVLDHRVSNIAWIIITLMINKRTGTIE